MAKLGCLKRAFKIALKKKFLLSVVTLAEVVCFFFKLSPLTNPCLTWGPSHDMVTNY